MKMIKMSALVLVSGLFFASCGDGANNDETPADTMQMVTPPMEEAAPIPDTVNGIDTTVNVNGQNNSTSMRDGGMKGSSSAASGSRTSTKNAGGDENNTGTSTAGQPTENPAKSPSNGNPANPPTRKAGSSPNM